MSSSDVTAPQAFAMMQQHLAAAAIELFAAYEVAVKHVETSHHHPTFSAGSSFAAIIGYAGPNVRGALTMVASRTALTRWIAMVAAADGASDTYDGYAYDTIGEFSNMLLGRLKGRLLPEGFPILLSTPTTTSTVDVGFCLAFPSYPSTWLLFDGPDWRLSVRLDMQLEDGFTLKPPVDRTTVVVEPGAMILF